MPSSGVNERCVPVINKVICQLGRFTSVLIDIDLGCRTKAAGTGDDFQLNCRSIDRIECHDLVGVIFCPAAARNQNRFAAVLNCIQFILRHNTVRTNLTWGVNISANRSCLVEGNRQRLRKIDFRVVCGVPDRRAVSIQHIGSGTLAGACMFTGCRCCHGRLRNQREHVRFHRQLQRCRQAFPCFTNDVDCARTDRCHNTMLVYRCH